MDEAIQAEKHADWIRSIVNQNEAMQAAGDALAEDTQDTIDALLIALRHTKTVEGARIITERVNELKAKLAAWNAAKEMR